MDSDLSQTLIENSGSEISKEEKNSEKDSGIEEVSPQHKTLSFSEDSDSDDNIRVWCSKKQTAIIDDDDDDDSNDNIIGTGTSSSGSGITDTTTNNNNHTDSSNALNDPVKNSLGIEYGSLELLDKEQHHSSFRDDDDDSDDDDTNFNIIKRKKPVPPPSSSTSSSSSLSQRKAPSRDMDLGLDMETSSHNSRDVGSDSCSSSNDDDGDGSNHDDDERKDSNDDNDEGFSAFELTAKLKAKLKKGAAKKPQKERASKTKAMNDIMELHSESQRLIRESKVNLPYHQPVSKSLNDFLNRAARKQQQYKALQSRMANEKLKIKFVQDTIESDSVMFKSVSYEENIDSVMKEAESLDNGTGATTTDDTEQSKTTTDSVSSQNNNPITNSTISKDKKNSTTTSLPSLSNTATKCDFTFDIDDDDDDEFDVDGLPDLIDRAQSLLSNTSHVENSPDVASPARLPDSSESSQDKECVKDIKGRGGVQSMVTGTDKDERVTDRDRDKNNDNDDDVEEDITHKHDTDGDNDDDVVDDGDGIQLTSNTSRITVKDINNTNNNNNSNSQWLVDSNGIMETDDPFMDQLLRSEVTTALQPTQNSSLRVKPQTESSTGKLTTPSLISKSTTKSTTTATKSCNNMDTGLSLDTEIPSTEIQTIQKPPRHRIPAELLGSDICKLTPKLSGGFNKAINLDGDDPEELYGTDLLMQRLMKNSATKKDQKRCTEVNISIVEKECDVNQKEHLKLTNVKYQLDSNSDPQQSDLKLDKPGSKLTALKWHLQKQIRKKRGENRQKRCDLYNLDNEEVFDKDEEEAELTDRSDTEPSAGEEEDDEEDEGNLIEADEDEEYDEEEEEELLGYKKKQRPKNAFVEGEAEEDDDYEGEDEEEEDEDDGDDEDDIYRCEKKVKKKTKRRNKNNDDDGDGSGEDVSFNFNLGQSDEESDVPLSQNLSKTRNTLHDEDDDDDGNDDVMENRLMSSKRNYGTKTPLLKTSSDVSCKALNLSTEDGSQDLYKSFSDLQSPDMNSNSLKFPLDAHASPMLDEQGFLRVKSTTVSKPKRSALDSLCDTQDNMDDIIGLCSGQFAEAADDRTKPCRTLFDDTISLNSQFPLSAKFPWNKKSSSSEADGENEGFETLKLLSDDEYSNKGRSKYDDDDGGDDTDVLNESDGEIHVDDIDKIIGVKKVKNDRNKDDGDEDEDEEEEDVRPPKYSGFTYNNITKKIRREFLEDEAELSGSEFDSDENDNLDDDFDIMEEEEGDKEKLDNDELRNQVGRVHLKKMIDEDKREVMKLQEMYLPDGDLYSEGAGRKRQFRWKNIDENSQQDMFNNESDKEEAEEEDNDDLKWRLERHNREKWLAENATDKTDTDSQFLKFGQIFFKQKGKQLNRQNSESKEAPKLPTRPVVRSKSLTSKGSFLSRSNDSLAKIAELTKPVSNPTFANKTNGRNFVFSVVSPEDSVSPTTPAATKKKSANSTPSSQPAKKQKIEPVKRSFSTSSVFHHID
ncbi:hypothetical protein Ahia01_000416600 [Argonauta hians]